MSSLNIDSGNGSIAIGSSTLRHSTNEQVNASLKGIKYVIFPNNKYGQVWDIVIVTAIWYYAVYIPFHFGISGGYFTVYNQGFMIFNIFVNATFFVDTWLAFFRAYRDENGRLVYTLKAIRHNYIRSGWFFINILASLPSSAFIYGEARQRESGGDSQPLDNSDMRLYFFLELFKLLRLARIKKLMNTSEILSTIWERIRVELSLALKFTFMITLVSHWLACIWGCIAFQEAGSFGDPLLENLNWIGNWYNGNYVEGGLNPIGWKNAIPRYWLCLFWAIQSITSIGYGNIVPVTSVEYGFANFLMLLSGIFWAYIIGNLVDVAQSMGTIHRDYIERMGEANQMIGDFKIKDIPESSLTIYTRSSKRIRRFITNQRDMAAGGSLDSNNTCTMYDSYPTLNILSPELQRVCALHLTQPLLETIPYLSSKCISPEEQADLALQCVTIEFSTTESFMAHSDLGRGILIFKRGFAVLSRKGSKKNLVWQGDITGQPLDIDEVLVEDDFCEENHIVYHFVGFAKVLFVPRSAIMKVLENNEKAWKCARWRYFMAALILYTLTEKEPRKSIGDDDDV